MRPCRDAGTNGHPDPGATGPRLISKGPPGPRRCPSRRMRRVAANQRSAAGPTPYLGPTCGEGPTCGRRPTHPGGMHGISRGPVAPGMPAPTNTRPGGTHGHGVVPRGPDVRAPGRCAAAFMRPCRDAGTNGHPDPGATGPRLISKGPPGPRRCPSRRMRRVAANQRSAAGPTPYLGPTCGRRPTHPGGMHGIKHNSRP